MMTVARSVADVLNDHVVFEVECIDRMYLNVYVPQLQYSGGWWGHGRFKIGRCARGRFEVLGSER
jgi:hypothetical protein